MSAITAVKTLLAPLGKPILGRVPGNVTGITFVVYVDQVEHAEGLAMPFRTWTIGVLVLSPLLDPAAADLALEDAVDDVLDAFDQAEMVRWSTANRDVVSEDFNAVRILADITMQPPPPAATAEE